MLHGSRNAWPWLLNDASHLIGPVRRLFITQNVHVALTIFVSHTLHPTLHPYESPSTRANKSFYIGINSRSKTCPNRVYHRTYVGALYIWIRISHFICHRSSLMLLYIWRRHHGCCTMPKCFTVPCNSCFCTTCMKLVSPSRGSIAKFE